METVKKVKTIVHLEPEKAAALKAISDETLAPISSLIRKAVDEFLLARQKAKKK